MFYRLLLIAFAFTADSSPVQILYPPAGGTVLALPHVSIIFRAHAPRAGQLLKSIKIEVDGRAVPEDAIDHCAICAGPNPAVIAARAPWTVHEGRHQVVITATDSQGNTYRSELDYVLDSSVPSLSGLTGGILFPNADVASAGSLRLGAFYVGGREDRNGGWLGVTALSPLPLEVVGNARRGSGWDVSWKANWFICSCARVGLSVGQRGGDTFAVVGWRTQPNYFNVSLGVGASDLPSAWLGMSYSLSHLTPRLRYPKKLDNFFAVMDLVRLHAEVDNTGKVNLGATLSHPYGWRVGVYRVRSGLPEARWQWQVSYSLPLR